MIVRGTSLPKDKILSGPLLGGCQKQRVAAAKLWLDAAEKAGLRPRMVQQSLASEDAGEWHIAFAANHGSTAGLAPLADELWDEVFLILEERGDIVPDIELKCWHGAVFLDDTGRRAVALRLRLARRSLSLSVESLCEPVYRNPFTAFLDAKFSEDELSRLCDHHGIPEEWLTTGTPEEIELPA